jgi:hypothetical protein
VSSIYGNPQWASVYIEQWPHYRRSSATRRGIVPITWTPKSSSTTTTTDNNDTKQQSSSSSSSSSSTASPRTNGSNRRGNSIDSIDEYYGGHVNGLFSSRPLIAGVAMKAHNVPAASGESAWVFGNLNFDIPVSSV